MNFGMDMYPAISPYLLRIPILRRKEVEKQINLEVMEEIKVKALEVYTSSISRVYAINWQRFDSIDLPAFLSTVKVESIGAWGFNVFVNEQDLVYFTKKGEPVYEIGGNGTLVENLRQYWKSPISGINEEQYILQESQNQWMNYISNDLRNYMSRVLTRYLK